MENHRDPFKAGGGLSLPPTAPRKTPPVAATPRDSGRHFVVGSALLFLGIGLLGLLLIGGDLPFAMPRSWYLDRPLWVAGGLLAVGAGWYLLSDSGGETGSDSHPLGSPQTRRFTEGLGSPGPRFARLVIYTRTGCHLCDEAKSLLDKYRDFLPPLVEVDIDGDPDLISRFSTCVPVVELEGKVRFRGRINELLLRRLIAATPPRDTTGSRKDL